MKEKHFVYDSLKLSSVLGLAITLGACASTKAVNDVQTDAQVCGALKNVITHAGSNFDSLKVGAGVADYDHTRWDTKSIFPKADCDVVGWGAGRTNYACTWSKADSKEALNDYKYGLNVAKTCLGEGWSSTAIPGVTGEGTRFSTIGNSVVVDIRMAQERSPSKTWMTSLIVGAPVNSNAR